MKLARPLPATLAALVLSASLAPAFAQQAEVPPPPAPAAPAQTAAPAQSEAAPAPVPVSPRRAKGDCGWKMKNLTS